MSRQKKLWYGAAALAVLGACGFAVPGMRFSGALAWAAALAVIAMAILDRLAPERRWAKWAERAYLVLLGLGLTGFLALEAWVISGAHDDAAAAEPSCVLILGAGVDGTEPSLMLQGRLEAALAFCADKPALPIVVSGCQGQGEEISEAECMARWLAARGVDPARIHKEEQASSTRTNFVYSLALMRELGLEGPFVCVSSDFHLSRARYIAGREGVPPGQMACVASSLPPGGYFAALAWNSFVREAFALANEMLMGVDLDL